MVNSNVKVKVPGLSSFDKSFKNILTTKVGVLTPICSRLLIPNTKGSLRIAISAALPPLASDTFMRADLKVEAFMVPLRLLYGGFESFLVRKNLYDVSSSSSAIADMPKLKIRSAAADWSFDKQYCGPGSLLDYLGAAIDVAHNPVADCYLNLMKVVAYHRVYDDWYRNAKVQQPIFRQPMKVNLSTNDPIDFLPYISDKNPIVYTPSATFLDGTPLLSLRRRNWGDDYFTIATPSPQAGSPQTITVSSNQFTISALRAGNSLQQYLERSNLASPRLQDYVKAHYGADLSSGVADRAVLLGSASYPVYSKGIEANSANAATNNPFATVAARYGNGFAAGSDFVCKFECNEPSYLMVIASLVPEACYASGIDREMTMFTQLGSVVDIPNPLLENTGNEPIFDSELSGTLFSSQTVFGYVPRYTHHKTGLNQVHGLLRNGESLASFVAQRDFSAQTPQISSSFLAIPTNALDNVTAVTAALSNYGCWIDSFIDLKVAEPLTECALPSLQDPAYEHGSTVNLPLNGSKL